MGYWAFSNAQKFYNVPPKVLFINKPPDPMHQFIATGDGFDQSHLALTVFGIYFIGLWTENIIRCFRWKQNKKTANQET